MEIMRTAMMSSILLYLLLLPVGAVGEDKWDFAAPHKQRCSVGSMLDMNECMETEYTKVDAKLNRLYKQLLSSLVDPESLRKSQAAWIKFRDLDCVYSGSGISTGGSLVSFNDNACRIDKMEKRIRDLERYLGWTCNGCPPKK